jgi:DNA/RNA endonuclease YhcR with UshA esterase domain
VPAKITPIATSQMLPQPAASESAYKLKRDPYPLPGEEFGKPLKPTLLGEANDGFAAGGQLQAKPGQIIPWNHARQYVGQTITVEGKVVLTNKTKTVCFLNFVENWRGRFYVVIFEKVLGSWPQSPEQYFLHKTIRVTGEVKDRRGTPQIQITDPKQIQIVTIPE